MNRSLPISLVLLVGLTGTVAVGAPAASARPSSAVAARDDQHNENYHKFNDHDRQAAHDYAVQHKNDRGFRDKDRLSPDYESRLHEGYVMDPDMRRMCRPTPPEMVRGMAPPPAGCRYVVVGGHVCLIDSGYRIHDAIHLELNLGL